MSATDILSHQHRACDTLFAACESAVRTQDWNRAQVVFASFRQNMERHFSIEELVLFPAYESASGSSMGPTRMMRIEHQDMRDLMDDIEAALAARQLAAFLGQNDTLLILMQQHNMKEECVLYPVCEKLLPDMGALIEESCAR
ncbi:hemerythrin domain-containing protein [Laribacter hongkongensis]|uniref:Hemerythrin n=1 Tax=Laribacter hongkongensis TaxID=168471 RepID=A0A248LI99_9NEIS|nr:hemerythrin domain-containing protein [Laribacter hongkongensis]ASJ24372.1 hemerythrin [Laribacter hongkongensis]MCG9042026.1 hemerythrin domain-containing protein [Laribacter hongkongensis]MCG9069062.1 hemerythrin domain-containing protein [Laribacter hongkongensis]MCG9087869.1 hemerythrin domain-containing protein [Laribacter hongkongensis]MCG9110730.1 hemerythrin domain-containing protein [Laribacter hongkongensis]